MIEPHGLGIWIAFPKMIGDPYETVARLCEIGAHWVAPRGADGSREIHDWTPEHTAVCREYDIDVYRWTFSRPEQIDGEVQLAMKWRGEGDAGYIIDAEMPWAHKKALASIYGRKLREAVGTDYFVADAPWAYVHYHPEYPWMEFDAFVDAHMPQYYWTEIGVSMTRCCDTADMSWDRKGHQAFARPIYPIGVTYGKEELVALGAAPCPSSIKTSDVGAFIDRYSDRQAYSLYSLEASNPDVIELLKGR